LEGLELGFAGGLPPFAPDLGRPGVGVGGCLVRAGGGGFFGDGMSGGSAEYIDFGV
jgi:hypothetical protein